MTRQKRRAMCQHLDPAGTMMQILGPQMAHVLTGAEPADPAQKHRRDLADMRREARRQVRRVFRAPIHRQLFGRLGATLASQRCPGATPASQS